MTSGNRPDEKILEIAQTGIGAFRSMIDGVTSIIRAGDHTLRDLDSALTGGPAPESYTPEQSFMEIAALLQATMVEAQTRGSVTEPAITQRAREILAKVNKTEPSWRPAPAMIKSVNDIIRMALRDLRGSANLINLAAGQGTIDDLDQLTKWADDLSLRITQTREVVAQPKPLPVPEPAAPQVSQPVFTPAVTAPVEEKPKRKRNTAPKKKPNPEDVAFAKAVAEEMGDTKVKDWADQFANGKISEKQWISRLTNHAAASRETLDDVFARATQRMAKAGNG
jgi:hypothetical protein